MINGWEGGDGLYTRCLEEAKMGLELGLERGC
jgi:hypothetical protein